MTPKVSILIPSYNHGRFLTTCIQGIIDQTLADWELILVDDGSKDDSIEIARSFSDPRIQVHINEKNLGTYGTEQKALELSKGQYVAVLNSDDLWSPIKLERQVELLERHPETTLCYTLGWKVNDEGVVDTVDDVHLDWPQTEVQEVLPYLMYENRILASGVLFRRSSLRFETKCRYSGDWIALLDQARRGPVACLTERVTFWRMHDNNTFVASPKQLAEEISVRQAIAAYGDRWARSSSLLPNIRYGLGRNAMNLFALHIYFHNRGAALGAGLSAIRLHRDKKSALKRTLSLALPMSKLRRHYWNRALTEGLERPVTELNDILANRPSLSLPTSP